MLASLINRLKPAAPRQAWEHYFEDSNETLLWQGTPSGRIENVWATTGLALFGLPFLFGGIVAMSNSFSSLGMDRGVDLSLTQVVLFIFSLPFLGIGLGLTFGIVAHARLAPQFIHYAVTNKRAYIATSWWTHRLASYPISRRSPVEVYQGRRADSVVFHRYNDPLDTDVSVEKIGFKNISDGMEVYQLLRDIQKKAPL